MPAKPKTCDFCCDRSLHRPCELAGITAPPHRAEITISHYRSRQAIFQEGNPPLGVYCVKSGMVKLYKTGIGGEHLIIRLVGPGRLFGYRAVLGREPYAATAEAVGAVKLCYLSDRVFQKTLQSSPDLCRRLLVVMAKELRISEDKMVALAQESVRVRTVQMFLSFLEEAGGELKSGAPVRLPLQRREMAQMVGTSPETFSRTLNKLAEDGAVRLTRSAILVRNPEILRSIRRF